MTKLAGFPSTSTRCDEAESHLFWMTDFLYSQEQVNVFSMSHNEACRSCAIFSFQGVLMDNAAGLHETDVVYVDTNPEQIESLAPTALHRPVDLEVVAADKEGPSIL